MYFRLILMSYVLNAASLLSGGLVGTVPIYNSEIASVVTYLSLHSALSSTYAPLCSFSPPEHRGLIGGLSGYMIGIGGFLGMHFNA